MKIFKNKFFVIIFGLIFSIFCAQFYFISNSFQRDVNTYVTLLEGSGKMVSSGQIKVLKVGEKNQALVGDEISTIGENSLALIEWGDKSITRLAGNSKIVIQKNSVASDLSEVQISFELLKGKTWSNVVSVLGKNSYFEQNVQESVAAVRGTVFEVDADNDFIFVHNHEVQIKTKSGGELKITSGQALSLDNFTLIENIKNLRDAAWEKLNTTLDEEYKEKLRQEFSQIFQENNPVNFVKKFSQEQHIFDLLSQNDSSALKEYLNTLPEDQKAQANAMISTFHQMLSFEDGTNETLYNLKTNARETLINQSEGDEKNLYLRYVMYDLEDLIQGGKAQEFIEKNTEILKNHKEFLEQNDFGFLFGMSHEELKNILFVQDPQKMLQDLQGALKKLDSFGQDFLNNQWNNIRNLQN